MHLSVVIFTFVFVAADSFVCATPAIGDKNVFCSRGNITAVRIEGCESEPCDVKKGAKIPIEVDFNFEAPDVAEEIDFRVFVPYWNVPDTGDFGSYIVKETSCEVLLIRACPAVALTKHTLKSQLYADPKLESSLGLGTTGEVNTSWILSPENKDTFAHCLFEVLINFIE